MKKQILTLCALLVISASHAAETQVPDAAGRWSAEKANEWYAKQPWPCGFNYVPAHAISYTEMWMPYNFDVAKMDMELALAEDVGFNCLRVVLPFVVWEHDPAAFKKKLDEFLAVCDRRGLRVMFCLFDDCGEVTNPEYGQQPEVVKGQYANAWSSSPGHNMVRDPKTWPRLERYFRDILTTCRDDRRVWVWDLYNEPTNSGTGAAALPLAEKVFEWARDVNPTQPLTIGTWNRNKDLNDIIFQNSDIITFHNYHNSGKVAAEIAALKAHGRPIINTEWLCRHQDSTPETCLPLFARENVGCMHWGLVNGRSQTHLHWGARPDKPEPNVWQHDLFHGDHEPYDAEEINLFRRTIREQKVINTSPRNLPSSSSSSPPPQANAQSATGEATDEWTKADKMMAEHLKQVDPNMRSAVFDSALLRKHLPDFRVHVRFDRHVVSETRIFLVNRLGEIFPLPDEGWSQKNDEKFARSTHITGFLGRQKIKVKNAEDAVEVTKLFEEVQGAAHYVAMLNINTKDFKVFDKAFIESEYGPRTNWKYSAAKSKDGWTVKVKYIGPSEVSIMIPPVYQMELDEQQMFHDLRRF